MAGALGHQREHVLFGFGVVEDEQPAREPAQDRPHGLDHLFDLLRFGRRQFERIGQALVAGADVGRGFGEYPPDEAVVAPVAVGVFEGELGFADPAEAAEGLGDDRGRAGAEVLVEAPEQVLAAGEVGVSGEGGAEEGQVVVGLPGGGGFVVVDAFISKHLVSVDFITIDVLVAASKVAWGDRSIWNLFIWEHLIDRVLYLVSKSAERRILHLISYLSGLHAAVQASSSLLPYLDDLHPEHE